MTMTTSVIIPSVRPEGTIRAVESIFSSVDVDIEVIVVTEEPVEIEGTINVVASGTPVEKWNIGAAHATGWFLVTGADDIVFQDGWLDAAVRSLKKIDGEGLVAFNDLSPLAGKLATHYMVTRGYAVADWGGVLSIPAYSGAFMDNEATARSMRDERFIYAEDAVVDHQHPFWEKGKTDEFYDLGMSWYEDGEATFWEREGRGFPNEWEPSFKLVPSPTRGFGRIAVTSTIYKHPDADSFWCWSNLLVGGLQTGDMLIAAPTGKPTHVSRNEAVKRFLYSDMDTLLMIDDDMLYDATDLHKLRNNMESWDYDVVQAFCTHKTYPPHAIVLHETVPQPSLPLSLKGRSYDTLSTVDDNTIIQVDAVGLAFTLIKRHVLEALVNEYGVSHTYDFFQWGSGYGGEDLEFSRKLLDKGFNLAVDTNVKIGHVGKAVYGWETYQRWARSKS